MSRLPAAVAMFLACSACSRSEELSRDVIVSNFSCVTGEYAVRLPPKFRDLREISKLQGEEKGHPGAGPGWENYRLLRFRNLDVAVTIIPSKGTYAVEGVRITGPEWKISGALRVGMSGPEILQSLGVKRPADGVWKLWQPGPEDVEITVVNSKVSAISYSCYTG